MQVLLDTNVVLDILLNREPWVTDAKALWQANDNGRMIGYITATTMTDIFYVARRLASLEVAYQAVRVCLELLEVCAVDRQSLEYALALPGKDFEDNLQVACVHLFHLEAIVTRNIKDFAGAPVPVLTPAEALAQIQP
jgi:predicted nucleic acid-binding protein